MRDIRTDLRERLASVAGRYSDETAEYDLQRVARLNSRMISANVTPGIAGCASCVGPRARGDRPSTATT
jgi:hypothetical protein